MVYLISLWLAEVLFLIFAQRKNISWLIVFILTNIILSVHSVFTVININQHYLSAESIFGSYVFLGHAFLNQKSNLKMKITELQPVFSSYCAKILYALIIICTTTSLLYGLLYNSMTSNILKNNLKACTAIYIAFYLTHLIYISIMESTRFKSFIVQYVTASLLYVIVSTLIISTSIFHLNDVYNLIINGALVKLFLVMCGFPFLFKMEKKVNFA